MRVELITRPTPLEPWAFEHQGRHYELLIKRDDLSSGIGAGNKSRKLEFLFAAALSSQADAVVSVGGTGSNHCRAVAAFAGPLGLACHLVLRKDTYFEQMGRPIQGNMLLDNIFGAHTHLVSRETYSQVGSSTLVARTAAKLIQDGVCKKPYQIPVGGSNQVGVWGYIEAVNELASQLDPNRKVDVICFASGSGGTATGTAIGVALCPRFKGTRVVSYIVCDNVDYFYDHVDDELRAVGLDGHFKARDIIEFRDARGLGYSVSRPEEIALLRDIARTSGVLLDPCYSGKAAFGFVKDSNQGLFDGKSVVFIHTGGAFGIFGLPREVVVDESLVHTDQESIQ